jgi:hypothetical protein
VAVIRIFKTKWLGNIKTGVYDIQQSAMLVWRCISPSLLDTSVKSGEEGADGTGARAVRSSGNVSW